VNDQVDNPNGPGPDEPMPPDERQALEEHGIEVEFDDMPVEDLPRRAASITLREEGEERETVSLDPAHQSLNQALRVSFTLLKFVMIILAVLFITSGFRTVEEDSRGLKLLFGAVQGDGAVDPGATWTYPQPLGELVVVEVSPQDLTVDAFVPDRRESEMGQPLSQLRRTRGVGLDPANDGYLLTSDGNIVHAIWSVQYRVDDVVAFEKNVARDNREDIVRVAIERGIVHSIGRTTIDDPEEEVYDPLVGSRDAIAAAVRREAQGMLDHWDVGVQIMSVTLDEAIPPPPIRDVFNQVGDAVNETETLRNQARSDATELLKGVAGGADERLVELIARYGEHLELDEQEQADIVYERIVGILAGSPLPQDDGVVVSGEVTRILEAAKEYQTVVRQQAESDYRRFVSFRDQFDKAPEVLISRLWLDAYMAVMRSELTQTIYIPEGTEELEVLVGLDRDVVRALEAKKREQEAEEAERAYAEERGLSR
jgi:regulator of protease activity HflC (stomatin/prohibitin superfamily)